MPIDMFLDPPSKVPTKKLHEHILPDLPGPIRLKQLIIWSLYLISKTKGFKSDSNLVKAVNELSQELRDNKINLSWYQRAGTFTCAQKTFLKTHPENEKTTILINKNREYQSM